MPLKKLQKGGHEVTGLFFNPNIHPLIEFRRRLKSLKVLQERLNTPFVYLEDYGLADFLREVDWGNEQRCKDCYRMRLSLTARKAAERHFDAFSTTLTASTHQDIKCLKAVGEDCANKYNTTFLFHDWRQFAKDNREKAGKMNLYLQQYCGCVFSEYERFKDTGKHIYKGSHSFPKKELKRD